MATFCPPSCSHVLFDGAYDPVVAQHLRQSAFMQFSPKRLRLLQFDVPQLPLRPTEDALSCSVYRSFEASTAKYDVYEQAVRRAVADLTDSEQLPSEPTLLMVGAGRGGILARILKVLARPSSSRWQLIALEKNPYAYNTLRYKNEHE